MGTNPLATNHPRSYHFKLITQPSLAKGVSLQSIYETGVYKACNPQWHVEDSPWKARQILKMLDKHDVRPSTVAEVGCGAGEILRQLQLELAPKTQFSGYDVSPQAIEQARGRENAGLKFYLEDLAAQDVYFDLLLVIDVFEHVDDYLGFLRRLASKAAQMIFHIPLDLSAQTVFREQSLLKTRGRLATYITSPKERPLRRFKTRGMRSTTTSLQPERSSCGEVGRPEHLRGFQGDWSPC